MRTSVLDTNSSCRTTGKVTRFASLVSGAFQYTPLRWSHSPHHSQDSHAAPIRLERWQDFCSRYVIGFELTLRSKLNDSIQIGLLPSDNEEQVPFAYRLYKRTDKIGCQLAAGYKQTFCNPVTIDFVGVWYAPSRFFHTTSGADGAAGTPLQVLDYYMVATYPLPQTTRR